MTNETALITGASGGIGLELARIFASNGINLVLVARNTDKLNRIASELRSKGIVVKIYSKDLSVLQNAKDLVIEITSEGIIINYLVNNAGFGINDTETNISWDREFEMLNLNMVTLTYFTKIYASEMIRQGFGRILNIGSTGSFQPGPYMAAYSASKAYVLHFSEAVNYELKGSGVTVSTLCPGVTDTGFHETAQTTSSIIYKNMGHATAFEVARYGYKMMMNGKSWGVYGFMNRFSTFMLRFTPRNLVTLVAAKLIRPKSR